MKGNKKQREKEVVKTKTKPPHSISTTSTAATAAKVLNVSKKSQVIQKKTTKPGIVQSKLVSVKNENGTKSLTVSKLTASTNVKTINAAAVKRVLPVSKSAAQVEIKVF